MPFTLRKRFTFEAAHRLPHHDGRCARLHGHTFVGWLVLRGEQLQSQGPKRGMLVDFGQMSAALQPLLADYLDHHHLNETTGLESPTSEELARWIYERLEPTFGALLHSVVVEENCTCAAEYGPSI